MLRSVISFLLAGSLFQATATQAADAVTTSQAYDSAAGSNAAISSQLSTQPAADATPGFTASPEQTGYNSTGSQQQAVTSQQAQCSNSSQGTQSSSVDASCSALNNATQAGNAVASPSADDSTSVNSEATGAQATPVQSITGTYSDCAGSTQSGSAINEIRSCYDYYDVSVGDTCTKTRDVIVTWSCQQGTREFNGATYQCRVTTDVTPATRELGDGGSILYECPQGIQGDIGYIWGYNNGDYWAYPVCRYQSLVPAVPSVSAPASESWTGCETLEARVPSGMAHADGDNSQVDMTPAQDRTEYCWRSNSVCSQPAGTRVVNALSVYRDCWAYTNTFNCVNLNSMSNCSQSLGTDCQFRTRTCTEYSTDLANFCTAYRSDYSCVVGTSPTTSVADCSGQTYTDDQGNAWNVGHGRNQDFGKSISYLEAAREAGKYFDASGLQIFRGTDNRCKKKLFGLMNCCKGSGSPADQFTNSNIAKQAGRTGNISTYMYDGLFGNQMPKWVEVGFSPITGDGGPSIHDLLQGNFRPEQLLATLSPSYWVQATIAFQMSQIVSCTQDEKDLAMKRDAHLCVGLGDYCSNQIRTSPWSKMCIERTETYCCFNSILGKLINVQGKAQLGISMGSAQSPNCRGFTAQEFQRLDLSRMDLSEFIATIKVNNVTPNVTNPTPSTQTSQQSSQQASQ